MQVTLAIGLAIRGHQWPSVAISGLQGTRTCTSMPESSEVAEIALVSARDALEIASCSPHPESFVINFVEGLVIAAFGAEAAAAGGGSCSSSPSSAA